jgi:RNA polymerase sigma factor (TIGR02999 family)
MGEPITKRSQSTVLNQLFPVLYTELRRLAARRMRNEAHGQSLQPTGLVHEVYIRLVHNKELECRDRIHFFALAGRVMRQVLVDRARSQLAKKRGGRVQNSTTFEEALEAASWNPATIIAIHDALIRLEKLDARKARVVELKFFSGLSNEEVAETLEVSASTVKQDWSFARVWLQKQIE